MFGTLATLQILRLLDEEETQFMTLQKTNSVCLTVSAADLLVDRHL